LLAILFSRSEKIADLKKVNIGVVVGELSPTIKGKTPADSGVEQKSP
jgi:hypothetical protein